MDTQIAVWEGEGGAGCGVPAADHRILRGTPSQVELAQHLRRDVSTEFDRVAKALEDATSKQSPENQTDAQALIAILEDKRHEVMANGDAGYFIHTWQELSGRVRQLIAADPRYAALKATRAARRHVLFSEVTDTSG